MKIHRLVVLIVDHDDLGAKSAAQELEHAHYPNDCIQPKVMLVETREVDWADGDHPLNGSKTEQRDAFANLFGVDATAELKRQCDAAFAAAKCIHGVAIGPCARCEESGA